MQNKTGRVDLRCLTDDDSRMLHPSLLLEVNACFAVWCYLAPCTSPGVAPKVWRLKLRSTQCAHPDLGALGVFSLRREAEEKLATQCNICWGDNHISSILLSF